MRMITVVSLLAAVTLASASSDFLTVSFNNCVAAHSWTECIKQEMLKYLDEQLGTTTDSRSLGTIDEAVISRTFKYLKSFNYGIEVPLVDVRLTYRPSRSLDNLDVEFESNEAKAREARGLLKKKLLLPLLLMLKLKLKALMPIFVAIIGIKAMKALIMSKLALLIVIVFVALQFFKKGGMMMPPAGMTMDPVYGAPPAPSSTSSYDPANTWDATGPYSRVWTPSNGIEAQNLAYSYYAPSSNTNSYGSSSSSSSSSASSVNSGSSTNY